MPGHKNLVNTNHGHKQRFQTVEAHRTGPGPLQLLFVFSVLTVLPIHNVDGLGGVSYPKWGLKALGFSPVDQGPPCFAISNGLLVVVVDIVYFLSGFATCAGPKMCSWILSWHG